MPCFESSRDLKAAGERFPPGKGAHCCRDSPAQIKPDTRAHVQTHAHIKKKKRQQNKSTMFMDDTIWA